MENFIQTVIDIKNVFVTASTSSDVIPENTTPDRPKDDSDVPSIKDVSTQNATSSKEGPHDENGNRNSSSSKRPHDESGKKSNCKTPRTAKSSRIEEEYPGHVPDIVLACYKTFKQLADIREATYLQCNKVYTDGKSTTSNFLRHVKIKGHETS